jgi:hypothetical protein
MLRSFRVESQAAFCHVMRREDGKQDILRSDAGRLDFRRTLAATCKRTAFQGHAYCVMRNDPHRLVQTLNKKLRRRKQGHPNSRWPISTNYGLTPTRSRCVANHHSRLTVLLS